MASGSEHYQAAEQALTVAMTGNSAMALRSAHVHASLALAAAFVTPSLAGKTLTALVGTPELQAWFKALASTGALPAIKADTDGHISLA